MTKRTYVVSVDNRGWYYAHRKGFPYVPIVESFSATKRGAQKWAAAAMMITLDEYFKETKNA